MKQYQLVIKVKELRVNYTDEVEAKNKQEAALKFYDRLPPHMADWKDTWLLESWIEII